MAIIFVSVDMLFRYLNLLESHLDKNRSRTKSNDTTCTSMYIFPQIRYSKTYDVWVLKKNLASKLQLEQLFKCGCVGTRVSLYCCVPKTRGLFSNVSRVLICSARSLVCSGLDFVFIDPNSISIWKLFVGFELSINFKKKTKPVPNSKIRCKVHH